MKTTFFKQTSLFLFGFLIINSSIISAQEGKLAKDVGAFNGIELKGTSSVTIEQTGQNTVTIEADEEILNAFKAEVKDGVLQITAPGDVKNYKIHVGFDNINKIKLSGTPKLISVGTIKTDVLNLNVDGASIADLNVEVEKLQTKAAGASAITVTGKADEHLLEIQGASRINAFKLESNNVNVKLSGAGIANVNAKKSLTGTISGLGNIYYMDEPENLQVETSGLGTVRQASEADKRTSSSDTTSFRVGSSKVIILSDNDEKKEQKRKTNRKKFEGNWGGLELGVNGWLDNNHKFDLPAGYEFLDLKLNKSIAVNLNLIEQNFNLYKNRVGLVSGLGFAFNTYQFSQNISLIPAHTHVDAVTDTTVDFLKNRLKITYLTVPLILEAQAGKKSEFHISGGMIFGLKINAFTKQVYEIDGAKYKDRINDDFNLNPFKADLTARVGWGVINLFANYSLTPLFKSSKQPEIYPFTVGLTVIGW